MCSPSPPPAPDYAGAAAAQGQANLDAARASAKLNNPNVTNPYGTQTVTYGGGNFDQAGYDKALAEYNQQVAAAGNQPPQSGEMFVGGSESPAAFFGPTAKPLGPAPRKEDFGYDPDIGNVTQTFSPEQQKLFDQGNQVKELLGQLGITGAESLKGVVGKNVDFSGLPQGPGSATDTRGKVIDAMMGRVNEDTATSRDQANSDLIAAGIRPGTKAYEDRMHMIDRGYNDARQQALLASGQEASRDFGLDTQRRKDSIAELLSQRQTPLNEINALMSGSQVSNPFAVPGYASNANVAPAPVFGAANAAGQYGTDVYNANVGAQNSMMGGLFGLGSAGIGAYGLMHAAPMLAASDRRLKSNIVRIGTHPLGIGIYEYDIFGHRDVGVMADEVLTVKPSAVLRHPEGYMMVDYGDL